MTKLKEYFKNIFNFIKPLVCDNGGGLSVGRVGLWVLLYKIWTIVEITTENTVTDIPENLLFLTIVFVAYNLSKKVDVFVKLIKAWKGTDTKDD